MSSPSLRLVLLTNRLSVSLTLVLNIIFLLIIVSHNESEARVTIPKIPQTELQTILEQASLNVKRRLEVIEPNILANGQFDAS